MKEQNRKTTPEKLQKTQWQKVVREFLDLVAKNIAREHFLQKDCRIDQSENALEKVEK